MTQAQIFYSGIVQGVGFRYTTQRIARDIGLCGWVKNLTDGRVEIRVEGEKEDIEQLVQKIEEYFEKYIKNKKINYAPCQNTLKEFQIVY